MGMQKQTFEEIAAGIEWGGTIKFKDGSLCVVPTDEADPAFTKEDVEMLESLAHFRAISRDTAASLRHLAARIRVSLAAAAPPEGKE